jgi:hypothetical protein
MALPQWTVRTGHELAEIEERSNIAIRLPLVTDVGVTLSVISGTLPPGIRIDGISLKGVPFEVNRTTDFKFTIRATTIDGISDRTFTIRVNGADAPTWFTPAGLLNVNAATVGQYWIDSRNTSWGLYATGGSSVFSEVTVNLYNSIPASTQGNDGDYAIDTLNGQFYLKLFGKWKRMNKTQLQAVLGNDIEVVASNTLPNANIVDYWWNTNILNNGLDLKIKEYDSSVPAWIPKTYFVGTTPPATPGNKTLWVQTFADDLKFIIKVYDASENAWEVLNYDIGLVPPERANATYFVLDSSLVDFQLQAIDTDLITGEELYYYIADGDGELPPGLTLSPSGKITGIIDPILALDIDQTPGFDSGTYDSSPLDFAVVDADGFDSYFYDTTFYGFGTPTRAPKKLNRYYEFTVTVADDVSESKRDFSLYVVGDDFLRSDNTIMKAGTGIFTADATYLRNPIWLTSGNLGVKRADNYMTVYLDVFDPNSLLGTISYSLKPYNDDGTESTIPPGLVLDGLTGELAGRVPYQPAVTKEYKFTVEASRAENNADVVEINAGIYEDTLSGRSSLKINKLPLGTADGVDDLNALVGQTLVIENYNYFVISVDDNNELYDLLNFDRELEPTYKAKPITIYEDMIIGNNYLYINDLEEKDIEFWKNKSLIFSSTEGYTLVDSLETEQRWTKYLTYTISADDSSSFLEFDYGTSNIVQLPGDTLSLALARYLDTIGINSSTELDILSETATTLEFNVRATANTRTVNLIKNVFHCDDSAPVNALKGADFIKVPLGTALTRNINAGQQYSLGALDNTVIVQRLSISNTDIVSTIKTFTLSIRGDVESTVTWLTDAILPTQTANRTSYLKLEAETTLAGSNLRYDIISGKLPFGLELKRDGEIIGKVNQYGTASNKGLTTIDTRTTTFDGGNTSFDREYTFTVLARDRFGYSAATRTFTLSVIDIDSKVYSNIYMQPFIKPAQKSSFLSFINDYTIFTPNYIYRPYDPEFGVQKNLRTLAFAGIEQKIIDYYVAAIAKNHKKKRYKFGDLKTAVAKKEGTNEVLYEVVYVDIIDPQEPTSGSTALSYRIKSQNPIKINQVKLEVKDDVTATEAGIDIFTITPRTGDVIKIAATASTIPVYLRSGVVQVPAAGQLEIINQSGLITVIRSQATTTNTSGDPMRFRPTTPPITADSNAIKSSQSKDILRYISNISNMRQRISEVGDNERQYLPLWMRTNQGSNIEEINYVTAMPICYCKPGTSTLVKENIINNGFDFKTIDYEIDRFIIDSTSDNQNEQFLLFANYRFNV